MRDPKLYIRGQAADYLAMQTSSKSRPREPREAALLTRVTVSSRPWFVKVQAETESISIRDIGKGPLACDHWPGSERDDDPFHGQHCREGTTVTSLRAEPPEFQYQTHCMPAF